MYKIPANTLFIGHQLIFVPECHSTNDEVQQRLQQKGSQEGLVVVTDNQTSGRGQRGNTWISEAGMNLTFSTGLSPRFLNIQQHFLLNIVASLAVTDTLSENMPSLTMKIKWPNDIMIGAKKTAGILIENQILQSRIEKSVLGIGLNVNQTKFSFPLATSLAVEAGHVFDRDDLLSKLLEKLEIRYLQLKGNEYARLRNDYEGQLFWRNEDRSFLIDEKENKGIIKGVSEDGHLMVLMDGKVKKFAFKEIQYGYRR